MRLTTPAAFGFVIFEPANISIVRQNYCGVNRGKWWPLGARARSDDQSRRLSELLDMEYFQFESERPHVCDDLELLAEYLNACDRLAFEYHGLICRTDATTPPRHRWLYNLLQSSPRLGIDISYANGGYSFLDETYDGLELAAFLQARLNANGLLDTVSDARQFMELHTQVNVRLETSGELTLEDLDGAMPLELWFDDGARGLRRAIEEVLKE
jgi:hypothetical protein